MRKYFYMVSYEYTLGDSVGSFDLGVFSTKQNAIKKINMSKGLPGFNKYGDLFKIIKFGVDCDNLQKKGGIKLYFVWLEYDENYEVFDYFFSKEIAVEKIGYFKTHTRIGKKHPDLFQISYVVVDDYLAWSEGFTSIDDI